MNKENVVKYLKVKKVQIFTWLCYIRQHHRIYKHNKALVKKRKGNKRYGKR